MSTPQPYRSPLDAIRETLKPYLAVNSDSSVEGESDRVFVVNPWSDRSVRLLIASADDPVVAHLNSVKLPQKYFAIHHLNKNEMEFIYKYALPSADEIGRLFKITVDNVTYECRFDTPSDCLMSIARCVQRPPGETSSDMRNLPMFRDAQRLDELPKGTRAFFKDRVPLSFYVTSVRDSESQQFDRSVDSINFALEYYDRGSPVIVVSEPSDPFHLPYERYVESGFPKAVSLPKLDSVLVELLKAARRARPRFAMIYYYQVLEYAGFYFLDDKARRRVRQFLRDPAVVDCGDDKLEVLIDIFTDSAALADNERIKKVIEERVNPDMLWPDVAKNLDSLCVETVFDGGFCLPPLVSKSMDKEAWRTAWHPKLADSFTRIRNVIVHARERRQAVAILPTWQNEKRLAQFVPLMRRLAEQVTLGTS